MGALKNTIRSGLRSVGYEISKVQAPDPPPPANLSDIPDFDLYRPTFSPWYGEGEFKRYYELAAPRTLVSSDRCYVLFSLAKQALHIPGDFWECGVYKGGTAALLAELLETANSDKKLYLFDTFEGMPATDPRYDCHKQGDFCDTSLDSVVKSIGPVDRCVFKKGFIPKTFSGLDDATISFAHVDVDIYKSIIDSLDFIWPRLSNGGFIISDDYGFSSCPGARAAVDDFFRRKAAVPLCIPTGQCIIFKSR
jgi:O-methyltransferase